MLHMIIRSKLATRHGIVHTRTLRFSPVLNKSLTDQVSEAADKVNKKMGKGLASALEAGEKATQSAKESMDSVAEGAKRKAKKATEETKHKSEKLAHEIKQEVEHEQRK